MPPEDKPTGTTETTETTTKIAQDGSELYSKTQVKELLETSHSKVANLEKETKEKAEALTLAQAEIDRLKSELSTTSEDKEEAVETSQTLEQRMEAMESLLAKKDEELLEKDQQVYGVLKTQSLNTVFKSIEFQNDFAKEDAYREISNNIEFDFTRNELVHKDGTELVPVSNYLDKFFENKPYLLKKPAESSGSKILDQFSQSPRAETTGYKKPSKPDSEMTTQEIMEYYHYNPQAEKIV